jgi:hypothetical protein
VKATFSSAYKDDEAAAMLKEEIRPVHSFNPLVQIENRSEQLEETRA